MTATTKPDLTAESVIAAIESARPDGITKLARTLGYRGSVSSWLKGKLLELVPDLADRLKANKGATPSAQIEESPVPTAKPRGKSASGKHARAAANPFREGSAYAATFDVLAANPGGIERSKLVEDVARITGKSQKKCYYDVTVVASSRKDGGSHRCIARAADRFYVDRTEGGWLKLVLRERKF